jgi:CDP-diacylglycerol--serine O-phosphatidyltransferase
MSAPKLADVFTLGNLAAGFGALLVAEPALAAGLMLFGALLDLLDGHVARWMKQASPLGVQLDSLADMVTFGVAPAVWMLRLFPDHYLVMVAAFAIVLCSAWRLAVFNLAPPSPVFKGLPTPANALWYVGLALWVPTTPLAAEWLYSPLLHALFSLLLSGLMVSRLPIPGFKSLAALRQHWLPPAVALVGGLAAAALLHPGIGINIAIFLFLLTSSLTPTTTDLNTSRP